MGECGNKYCIGGIELITCCSGRECGCMGQPVAARYCQVCNKEKREPSEEVLKEIEFLEWLDVLPENTSD